MAHTQYVPVGPFVNGGAPMVNAANLNQMEAGISAANIIRTIGAGYNMTLQDDNNSSLRMDLGSWSSIGFAPGDAYPKGTFQVVNANGAITQTYVGNQNEGIWLRQALDGVWGAWQHILNSDQVASTINAKIGAGALHLFSGAGIDPTGQTDSTAGANTFFANCAEGDYVIVPAGGLYVFSNTVTIPHRITLQGGGELRWVSGIGDRPAIDVTATACSFLGLTITNPNHVANQTGNRTSGIHFQGNAGRVIGCNIIGQQQAICVEVQAGGEYHDFIFEGNFIFDVPGSGDGSGSGSANGEDRGDGIVCWGTTATITGNRVTALAGTDARIGIHVEALGGTGNHPSSLCTITGNVVTGQFRRGITNEGLTNCVISANTIADATWYGINIVGSAHYTSVTGNTIQVTRTTADTQGAAWSPIRSGIMVYDNATATNISNNTITVMSGASVTAGIALQVGAGGNSTDLVIQGNEILSQTGNLMTNGIAIANGATRPHILNNRISGFSSVGVNATGAVDIEVRGNAIVGMSGAVGVQLNGASTNSAKIDDNTIRLCSNGIQAYNRGNWVTVIGNTVEQASVGLDMNNTAAGTKVTYVANTWATVTTPTQNMPSSGLVSSGNN